MRTLSCRSQSRVSWQDIPAQLIRWREELSVPWRSKVAIHIAEGIARQLSVRWRARRPGELNTRHLHLMDSQVTLSNAAKGRSSSYRLRHVLLRTSATLLGGHIRDLVGFTRTDQNPADAPSRWK